MFKISNERLNRLVEIIYDKLVLLDSEISGCNSKQLVCWQLNDLKCPTDPWAYKKCEH
jgi:hypothetical protein